MKNWALLFGGLALLSVVLIVLIGGNDGGNQNLPEQEQTNTVAEGPTAADPDTGLAEAGMDRTEATPTDASMQPSAEEAADGFVTALAFTGPAADLTLRLLDGQGRPAANAHMEVNLGWGIKNEDLKERGLIDEEAWLEGNKVATDDQGRITIQLPAAATLSLNLGGPNWRSQMRELQPLQAGESVDIGDVHLSPASLVRGQVLNAQGEGLAEATLQVSPAGAGYWGGGFSAWVQSEEDGHYELPSIPAGSYKLTVTAVGYVQHEIDRIELGLQDEREEDFVLSSGDSLSGRVLAANGNPVEGAQVHLIQLQEEYTYWGDWRPPVPDGDGQAVTDADGRFTVHGIAKDKMYSLGARAEGHASAQMDYEGENQDVTLRLAKAFAVSGQALTHDGKGMPDLGIALILVRGADEEEQMSYATTDEEGHFAFQSQGAGSYRVEVQDSPVEIEPLVLQLNEDREDLEFKLPKAPGLRVHVINQDGEGIPFATVSLAPPGSNEQNMDHLIEELAYASVEFSNLSSFGNSNFFPGGGSLVSSKTDESGWAEFPAIEGGDYELIAHAMGYSQLMEPLSLGLESKDAEITLTSGANLQLFLTDDSGEPVRNLPVTLKNAASGEELNSVNTDALGRAVWQDLEPGLYQIAYRANEADGWWWGNNDNQEAAHDQPVVELKAGENKEQTLIVHDLALLTVTVHRGGVPAAGIGVRLEEVRGDEHGGWYYGGGQTGEPTDGRGQITLSPVKSGAYEVIVKSSQDTPELRQRVELHGGSQQVEVSLNGARVEGKLLGKNSGQLAGAKVALIPYEEEIGEDGKMQPKKPQMSTNWGPNGVEFVNTAEMSTSTRSDASGNYAFRDVPEGRWMVVARAEGHAPWTSDPFQVRGDDKADMGTRRLNAMATIEGRDENWQPNQQQDNRGYFSWRNSIRLELADSRQSVGMAQIDENGKYRLTEIGAGTYRLRKGSYKSEPFEIREGENLRMDIPLEQPKED